MPPNSGPPEINIRIDGAGFVDAERRRRKSVQKRSLRIHIKRDAVAAETKLTCEGGGEYMGIAYNRKEVAAAHAKVAVVVYVVVNACCPKPQGGDRAGSSLTRTTCCWSRSGGRRGASCCRAQNSAWRLSGEVVYRNIVIGQRYQSQELRHYRVSHCRSLSLRRNRRGKSVRFV